jgi:hypothetical protein
MLCLQGSCTNEDDLKERFEIILNKIKLTLIMKNSILVFCLTSLMWCIIFSWIIGKL